MIDLEPYYYSLCEYKKELSEKLPVLLGQAEYLQLILHTFSKLDKNKGIINKLIQLEYYDKKPNNGRYYSYKKNK